MSPGVELEAYTPFIPLNRDDSSYPVIVMRYTIKNTSDQVQETAIAGWVENFSNFRSGQGTGGVRLSGYREQDGLSAVECWAKPAAGGNRSRTNGSRRLNGPRISGPLPWGCWVKKSRTSWISSDLSRACPAFLFQGNRTRKMTKCTKDLSARKDLPRSDVL